MNVVIGATLNGLQTPSDFAVLVTSVSYQLLLVYFALQCIHFTLHLLQDILCKMFFTCPTPT